MNLEECKLSNDHSNNFAKSFNRTNNTILGLHFRGNSNYRVNSLGYLVKDIESNIEFNDYGKIDEKEVKKRISSMFAPHDNFKK